jgi:hypothetical protein
VKFSPFNFQAPLAAGGVTLMAFNWLQFAIPHGAGSVKLSDIHWAILSPTQTGLYGLLVGLMLVLTTLNLLLTVVFLKDLAQWVAAGTGYQEFMSGPPSRITGIFVPIASLAMTMAVVFASAPFFVPAVAANTQAMVLPGTILFAALLLTAFWLEARVIRLLVDRPLETAKLNFVWLLDVFAFGLLALAGTGLASLAANRGLASATAFASTLVLGVGTLLLAGKLALLVYTQSKSRALPESQLLPAFFLVVPITCLYGISYYRIMLLAQKWFALEVKAPSYALITVGYIGAVAWALVTVYLLRDYFRNYFRTSDYFPTQWAMV